MFHFHVELYSKIVKEDETKYLLSMINGELQMVDVMEENAWVKIRQQQHITATIDRQLDLK